MTRVVMAGCGQMSAGWLRAIRETPALADQVEIVLDSDEENVCLTVSDNGRGFGRKQWHIPRAAALRIHDNQLRIANGGLHNPDDHLLLDWIKN